MSKSPAIQARWNKDMSITFRANHRLIHKFTGTDVRQCADAFCEGWFGTADKTKWKVRWTFG